MQKRGYLNLLAGVVLLILAFIAVRYFLKEQGPGGFVENFIKYIELPGVQLPSK